jgi:hypothetical protein
MSDPEQMQRTLKATFVPKTFDAAARTVRVLLYSKGFTRRTFNPRDRWSDEIVEETFSLDSKHMRMERAKHGLPLLADHAWSAFEPGVQSLENVLGKIENITVDGAGIWGDLRFSQRAGIADIVRDVEDGILDAVSMGVIPYAYTIQERDGQPALWTATDWELVEGSLTPIQADPRARTQSARDDAKPSKEPAMPEPKTETPTPEAATLAAKAEAEFEARVNDRATKLAAEKLANTKELVTLASKFGVAADVAEKLATESKTFDAAKLGLLAAAAEKQKPTTGTNGAHLGHIEVGTTEQEKRREVLSLSVQHRLRPGKLSELAPEVRQYAKLRFAQFAQVYLEERGVRTIGLSEEEIVKRAFAGGGEMTRSDFALITEDAVNKRLQMEFNLKQGVWKRFSRSRPFSNFKAINVYKLSEFPDLLDVAEGEEYEYGTLSESKESYRGSKRGRLVALTWEAMIDDDLGAFDRILRGFARAARRWEDQKVTGFFTANSGSGVTMGDGVTLFHDDRGNISGTGGAASLAVLSAAYTKMGLQTVANDDGSTDPLELQAKYWMTPQTQRLAARAVVGADIVANTVATSVDDDLKGVEVLPNGRLDATSTVVSYLVADPADIDTMEHGYLRGQEGPTVEQEAHFTTDGITYKGRHTFAAQIIEPKAFVKIPAS